jgi:3-deoxy-D-arabino-heptulosonate 7-phosphate (DAHP) synthase
MRSTSVRHDLTLAADAITRAAETTTDPDTHAKLRGMAEQLNYSAEDDTSDPEALG